MSTQNQHGRKRSDAKESCPYCKRALTQSFLAEKRRRKVENAKASTAKRIANGNGAGGRTKIRDDNEIKDLRAAGLSIRQIAKEIGMSTMAVQRGLKS